MTIIEKLADRFELGYGTVLKAVKWLRHYGYLQDGNLLDGEFTLSDITEAIKLMQKFAGLTEDGTLSEKVLRVMSTPRCSVPDIPRGAQAASTGFWAKDIYPLTWYVEKRDNDLTEKEWDDCFELAFEQTSKVCDIHFKKVNRSSEANLIISVGSSRRDGFDGPGGTLAWAQLPPSRNFKGQLLSKFDVGETWLGLNSSGRGIYLLNVANHEFLHLLGLGHSRINSALMAPYYNPQVSKPQQNDDITKLQRLYGPPKQNPTPDPDPDPDPDCPPSDGDKIKINIECEGHVKDNVVLGNTFKMDIEGFRIQKLG